MRLVVKILDTEVLVVELGGVAAEQTETTVGDATSTVGDATSMPVGFGQPADELDWKQGVERW